MLGSLSTLGWALPKTVLMVNLRHAACICLGSANLAAVILTEKGLDIIVESLTMGRITYGNTVKYIKVGIV